MPMTAFNRNTMERMARSFYLTSAVSEILGKTLISPDIIPYVTASGKMGVSLFFSLFFD